MYHEENLSIETKDMCRALTSLKEELEAVDWYNQRIEKADDPELKKILQHNADEEKEHAAQLIKWIADRDPVFLAELKKEFGF